MTPNDIIPGARRILNDEEVAAYRNTDAELLGFINDCLHVLVNLRPDLFREVATHACSAGAEQTLNQVRQVSFVSVLRINGGAAVLPTSRAAMDAFMPTWYSAEAGPAVNWMPHTEIDTKFYVYPPAEANAQLDVVFIQAHAPVTALSDTIYLPDNYAPAIQAFVVNRVESKDDEHVTSGRAAAFMSDFAGMVKTL